MWHIILSVIVIYMLYLYFKHKVYLNKYFSYYDGPKGYPLIGHMMEIKYFKSGTELNRTINFTKAHGRTYKLFAGMEPVLFTSEAALIEHILGSNKLLHKSIDYTFFKRWWGDGLLTSTGDKWRKRRKILTPAFHYNILEDFIEIFNRRGKYLINNLSKSLNKESFNIFDYITLYTLDVICETAMGTTVNCQENPENIYISSVKEMCEIAIRRTYFPWYRSDFIYELTPLYQRELKVVKVLTDFSSNIIKNRREALTKNTNIMNEVDEHGRKAKCSFLDILLQSSMNGEPLTDEDIREEVDTFLFEGHDTTAIALSMITYNLSNNPKAQAKAYAELHEIFGDDKERDATMNDCQNMKYLEMVIKESLRMYPSVGFHARCMPEDTTYNGKIIPKGTNVIINLYALHRNEDVFPDPETFDPERFTAENSLNRHPYSYIPFSAGPRNCIGQKFAMLEMKSAISKILRNYELLPTSPKFIPKLMNAATILSLNGVCMQLKLR